MQDKKYLYDFIYEYILKMYLKGELVPGGKVPAEIGLSEALGISRVSVRAGYQMLEEAGVIHRSRGRGTFLTTDTKLLEKLTSELQLEKNSYAIQLIVPEFDYFFPQILKGIEHEAYLNNCTITVAINSSMQKEKEAIEKIIATKVDGVLFAPNRFIDSIPHLKQLTLNHIPYVLIGKPALGIRANAVYTDDVPVVYSLISAIKKRGYHSVIHISNSKADLEAVAERKEGFILGMRDFFQEKDPVIIDASDPAFPENVIPYLRKGTAIYMVEDFQAQQIFSTVKSAGYDIPGDIGIVGTNNSMLCEQTFPPLTSISHSQEEEGMLAFRTLLKQIKAVESNTQYVKHYIMDGKIVWRDSL